MFINFDVKFKNLDGVNMEETINKETGEKRFVTLKSISTVSLLSMSADSKMLGDEKVKRYDLSLKIHNSNRKLDLKVEDIALIKKLIGEVYPPLVVGQAFKILEKEEVIKDKNE